MSLLLTGVGKAMPSAPPSSIVVGTMIGATAPPAAGTIFEIVTTAPAPEGATIFAYFDTHSAIEPAGIIDDAELGLVWLPASSVNQGGRKKLYYADAAGGLPSGTTITATSGTSARCNLVVFYATGLIGGALDTKATAAAFGTSTTPSITSPTLASGKRKLVIAALELGAGGLESDITEAAGYTTVGSVGNTLWLLHLACKVVAAAATDPETYAPVLGTSRAWVADLISHREA